MPLECFNRRTHLNVIVNSTSTYLIIDVGWGCMHITFFFYLTCDWIHACQSFSKANKKQIRGIVIIIILLNSTGQEHVKCAYTGWNIHDCVSHYECGNSRLFSFLSAFTGWVHWITSHGIFWDIVVSLFIYLYILFLF